MLTKALAEVDRNLTITSVRTMEQQVALLSTRSEPSRRSLGLFGGVALLLAAVGLYGVTAYTVAQRTTRSESAWRSGPTRHGCVDLVLRGAFARVVAGLVIGIPVAVGAGRLISAQLYGVSFWDPAALGIAAGSLAACAFLAAVIPARRAASISPLEALRSE